MNRTDWPVGPHGVRPAGPPDRCFYCDRAVGEQHDWGCVIRRRTVVVRTTITHTFVVPEHWKPEEVGMSGCQGNVLQYLVARGEHNYCFCGNLEVEYVDEATATDEKRDGVFIDQQES